MLEALVLGLRETLLVVALVVAVTAVVAELVLLTSAMLTVMIVAVVALSVQPLTPALVRKISHFAFVAHALRRMTPLRQYLLSRDYYHRDNQNALTTPLLHSLARPPCGFEADCHGLPHCV